MDRGGQCGKGVSRPPPNLLAPKLGESLLTRALPESQKRLAGLGDAIGAPCMLCADAVPCEEVLGVARCAQEVQSLLHEELVVSLSRSGDCLEELLDDSPFHGTVLLPHGLQVGGYGQRLG